MSNAVLANLGTLSEAELRELSARVSTLLGSNEKGPSDKRLQVVYDQMQTALRAVGVIKPPPFSTLSKMGLLVVFKTGAETLLEYEQMYLAPQTDVERVKTTTILVGVIVSYLQQRGVPITLKTLCQNLGKVSQAVESAFPGYRGSGLLPMIVKKFRVA